MKKNSVEISPKMRFIGEKKWYSLKEFHKEKKRRLRIQKIKGIYEKSTRLFG